MDYFSKNSWDDLDTHEKRVCVSLTSFFFFFLLFLSLSLSHSLFLGAGRVSWGLCFNLQLRSKKEEASAVVVVFLSPSRLTKTLSASLS